MPRCRYDYDCPFDLYFDVGDGANCMNCDYWEDDDDEETD